MIPWRGKTTVLYAAMQSIGQSDVALQIKTMAAKWSESPATDVVIVKGEYCIMGMNLWYRRRPPDPLAEVLSLKM